MSKIVSDFIRSGECGQGVGFWESSAGAVQYSRAISVSQKRKWKRYGIIPAPLFRYLEAINAIQKTGYAPERERTVQYLLDLLWETPERNEADRSDGEILRAEILRELGLLPKNAMASAQHLYIRAELYGSALKSQRSEAT